MLLQMYMGLHEKTPVIIVRFFLKKKNLNFLNNFSKKKFQISNFIKKSGQQEPSCSMRKYRPNMTKQKVAFLSFAFALKKTYMLWQGLRK